MRINRFRRDDRGAAAVEFALVLPILVVLVFGIVDFGRALFAYNYLTSAVREGGRFAAVQGSASAEGAVRDRMTTYLGQLNSLALPPVPADKITSVPDDPGNPAMARYITVSITGYELEPITPIPALLGITTFTFSPSAVFRWERAEEP
ncbi:MAG: TadE/TadG family type IV pilus assembly protein [Gemmatimonadaceae bacterium]